MRKCLFVLLNIVFRKDLESLYGKGSKIEITNLNYCTNDKHYSIQCKLYITDISLFEEVNTEGVEYLFEEVWELTGVKQEKIALTTSVDFIG